MVRFKNKEAIMKKLFLQREQWIELLKSKNLYEGPYKNRKVILLSLVWAFRNSDEGMHIANGTLGDQFLDCSEDKAKKLLAELFKAGFVTKKRNYNNPSSYFPSQLMKDSGKPFISKEKDSGKPAERFPESTKPSSKEEGIKGKPKKDSPLHGAESFCERTYSKYLGLGYTKEQSLKYAETAYKINVKNATSTL